MYTLAGIYTPPPPPPPPPPTVLPLLFPFTTSIFPKFLFYHFRFPYIIYSTFSILIVFPVFRFQCPLFRLPHVISSNQFLVVLPVRRLSIFPNSWPVISLIFFCQISHFQFSSLLDCFSASIFQFLYGLVSYFPNSLPLISPTSCTPTVLFQIFSLFVFSLLLLFQFSFFVSMVSEFPYRLPILDISFKVYLVFSEFSFNFEVFFPFHLLSRLFAIRFQVACFYCCLSFKL